MAFELRPYQTKMVNDIKNGWNSGLKNLGMVLPTGAGKTTTMARIVDQEAGAVCIICHRQELVSQISLALAENGIEHNIISPMNVIKMIIGLHSRYHKKIFYNHQSHISVAGVDTIIRRGRQLKSYLPTVNLWIVDEVHHLVRENKWHSAVKMMTNPNVRGLGLTATPLRSDGQGLGRISDGVIDELIKGPSMRELINQGYLTEYKIFAPVNNLDVSNARVSKSTGDYNLNDIGDAVSQSSLITHKKSSVYGDVVGEYLKICGTSGLKLGVTFVPTMEIGTEITFQYNEAGVPAILLNAKTPDDERADIMDKFRKGIIKNIVNVDILGEGVDIPAIEIVSMVRKTESYGLYVQQFGRALRLMNGKQYGIIIDHVGNVIRHGLPDSPRDWSLERRDKRAKSEDDENVIPLKACPECTGVYERYRKACPHCGHIPEPAKRSGPEYVDGDLSELLPEVLAAMRGEVEKADSPIDEQIMNYRQELLDHYCKPMHVRAHCKRKEKELQHQHDSQLVLRDKLAWWAGYRRHEGISDDDEIKKIFYLKYGVDWLSAQALPGKDADILIERIGEVS